MSSRSDRFSDEVISQFLRSRSADPEPGLLDDIVRRVAATSQGRPWLGLGPLPLPRPILVIVVVGLLLAVAGAIGAGSWLLRPDVLVTPLPTTPDAWERVLIETPQGSGSVASVVASPRGLLAVIQGGDRQGAGDGPTRLATSPDGRTWTLVPEEQHPPLGDTRGFGLPSVVGTDQGFLLVQFGAVWTSADGSEWRPLAGTSTDPDPDLSMGGNVAAVGGPGLVAVGGDKAWYSEDGSDWSLAAVPPLPAEILARPDEERYVDMRGITAAGGELVAWGIAEVPLPDAGDEHLVLPLVWASHDGRTWTDVADRSMTSVSTVAGGPAGFVAAGQLGPEPAVWFSGNGRAWERIVEDAFESRWPEGPDGLRLNDDPGDVPIELRLAAAAAGETGYLVAGVDGFCMGEGFCASDEAVIWTSADGRSWTRVPNDGRFEGGHAKASTAWGSRFVVGGEFDGMPAVWTSTSERSEIGP